MGRPGAVAAVVVSSALLAGLVVPRAAADSSVPVPVAGRTEEPGSPGRRPDLIGRRVELPDRAGDEEISAIVELTGSTVGDRVTEQPGLGVAAAERVARTEQATMDAELRRAGATITGRLVHALNAVTVRVRREDLDALRAVSGVREVQPARLVARANGLANAATGVPGVWQNVGLTGDGVTIGVIDDGIDYTHADFGGPGTPEAYQANDRGRIEPGTFPTAKVVGGHDFVGDAYDASDPETAVPAPDSDPLACGVHGTHVAGTAAGFGVDDATGQTYQGAYDAASLSGVSFRVAPGAAPRATLRAYKVFGCFGTSDDAVIVRAIDRAVADRVDVLNLSLGAPFGTGASTDLLVKAVTRANRAGTLVVAAAGNSGGGPYVASSPATADVALAVAAKDAGPTTFPGVEVGTVPPIPGVETSQLSVGSGVTGQVDVVVPGCTDGDYANTAGKIVVVSLVAGCVTPVFDHLDAVLAVVVVVDDFFRIGFLDVTVPFVLVHAAEAAPLLAAHGSTITLGPGPSQPNPQAGRYAGFSSGGPRRGDSALKPDITGPGVSLVSARTGTGAGSLELSGTSMAAPHVAGIAALVAQAHPTWRPGQIKAALMSTAVAEGVSDHDPVRGGTGLVDAGRAATTAAFLATADGRHSLGFGSPALSTRGFNRTRTVRLTNTSSEPITYDLSAGFDGASYGASVTVSPSRVTVPGGATRSLVVRLRLGADQIPGLPDAAASDFGELASVVGAVVATPTAPAPGRYPLRMAFVFVPKGVSAVSPPARVSASSASVAVRNRGRHRGTADVFQWLVRDRRGDQRNPEVPDLVDVGFKSFPWDPVTQTEVGPDRQVVFAVSLARGASTHSTQDFVVVVDVDGDRSEDFALIAGDEGLELVGVPNGRFVTLTVDLTSFLVVDAYTSEAPHHGSVVYLRTTASSLGTTADSTPWSVWFSGGSPLLNRPVFDAAPNTGWVTMHPFRPALAANASAPVPVAAGATVNLAFVADPTAPSQSVRGLLVVSPDDAAGPRSAEGVTVTGL